MATADDPLPSLDQVIQRAKKYMTEGRSHGLNPPLLLALDLGGAEGLEPIYKPREIDEQLRELFRAALPEIFS